MVLRKIGSGVTDVNGVAVMSKDATGATISHSYTGCGVGELDLVAKYTVDGSTVVSEPYPVLDCVFYDDGVTDPKTGTWSNSNMTVSIDTNEGTTLSHTGYATYFADDSSHTGLYDWSTPFAVEMLIISQSNCDLQIYDGTGNATRTFAELGITGNNKVKIVNTGSAVKYFVDGVEKTASQVNVSLGASRVGFRTSNNGGNVKYKDFCIYPI